MCDVIIYTDLWLVPLKRPLQTGSVQNWGRVETGDQIRFWLICWQNTHWLKMFFENLRWEFPFQICPHSCRKPPFKACSPTLGWIYGGSFYLKVSDFSTKPFSQIPQSPFADPLLPSGNNSSRGKYLIWGLLSIFYPFLKFSCLVHIPEPICTHPIWIYASLGV